MRERTVSQEANRRLAVAQLLAQLQHAAAFLEFEMQYELDQAQTRDPGHVGYPLVVRNMGTRLRNLRATIAALDRAETAGV